MEKYSVGFFAFINMNLANIWPVYVVKNCYFMKGFAHVLFLKSKNLYL